MINKKQTVLYIVIPCYNEQEVLPITAPLFLDKLKHLIVQQKISDESRILFVNDGSSDNTWEIIKSLSRQDKHYIGIAQSRNRGHQNAVLAGLMESKDNCDITISIDCDGQDDINAMDKMIDLYHEGNEIVYGVRDNRDSDTFFKRFTAESFYKLLNSMGVQSVYNHADYRLISSRALQSFSEFQEVNLFLRGMIPLVGYRSATVYYARKERIAGESHYPLRKMLALAVDGITSLSIKPIRMVTCLGAIFFFVGVVGIIWSFFMFFLRQRMFSWASIIYMICFIAGIQLLSLGIVGEYIGKIYLEVKRRPRYIISERTGELPMDTAGKKESED